MQRTYLPPDQPGRSSEFVQPPLIQHICTWAVVALLAIVVFSLLGARVMELYDQFTLGIVGLI
jgi:hypothetical protein